jgi:MtrB/PioB family decaheme-associated outer membrane protein
MIMKIARSLPVVFVLSLPAMSALAADDTTGGSAVDTSNWKCESCPFEKAGKTGSIDLGVGYVSNDSFKFGEYTGLNEKGGYLVGNAELRQRGENAYYWNLNAYNLGLDSRELQAEGGRQGKYKLLFDYDELPHFISDSASTPLLGTGTNSLTLPPGWVRAGSTAGMTALAGNLREVGLETKRKRLTVGAEFITDTRWEYSVKVRHETKEGTMRVGGAFFFSATQLVVPVDYTTDQLDVSASYATSKWQTRFSYYSSMFRNSNDALTWQNPFVGFAGADAGQLAAPPDNEFHQIMASGAYQFTERTRATADLAIGRMTQNDSFLASTLNGTLAAPALPRNSLDGKVDTLNANLRVMSDLTDRLRLNAAYVYNDRDNKTPQSTYTWVTTDSFVATPRENLPYSFKQSTLKLSADYRVAPRVKASAGVDHDTHNRTFLEAEETRENSIWGKVVTRAHDNVDLTVKVAHADRTVSNYQAVSQISPPENPLLRKYNMADRKRDSAGLRTNITPTDTVAVGFGIDVSKDEYPNSTIGLTSGDDVNISADTSISLGEKTSLQFYANQERIRSMQAGSQTFSTPDWTASNDDTITAAGIGVKHQLISDKLDVGADYSISKARGDITVTSGLATPFPELTTHLNTVKLYANYAWRKNISLHGAYWYERFRSEDWSLDGVAPDTIANVLALGETPPSYHAGVFTLFMRYKF